LPTHSEQSGAIRLQRTGSLSIDDQARPHGNTFAIGAIVMTQYVVALQIAGVLLLISMVGAVALSRKKVPMDIPWAAPPTPLGEAGRQAEPY
jgi:hypothetical protein